MSQNIKPIAYPCSHVTAKRTNLAHLKVFISSLSLTLEHQGASQPTLLWLAMPKPSPSEPSVSDSFPLDIHLQCNQWSQARQRRKCLPKSATGNKYHSYDTASINYSSLQHRSLLTVRDRVITGPTAK
jgi:hypothetical protein